MKVSKVLPEIPFCSPPSVLVLLKSSCFGLSSNNESFSYNLLLPHKSIQTEQNSSREKKRRYLLSPSQGQCFSVSEPVTVKCRIMKSDILSYKKNSHTWQRGITNISKLLKIQITRTRIWTSITGHILLPQLDQSILKATTGTLESSIALDTMPGTDWQG